MSNPFYYLAGLLLVTAYPMGIEPLAFAEGGLAPWAVLGSWAVYGALCWAVLARPLRRPPLARFLLRLAALALYAEILFVFHFPLWVWELGAESDPLASTLLSLAPLIALYGILAFVHSRTEPHSGGLRFAFRGFLGLSFLPILLMLGLDEAFERIDVLRRTAFVYPAAGWILALGSLALLMIFLPALLRLILGARPLEQGPLRSRLERRCDAAGFHAAELWIVPTGTSRMANAFVVGLSARWRYVFFTEAILEGMSPEDLECVLLHEITHSQKRHILFYLIAALAFSLVSGLGHEALEAAQVPTPALLAAMLAWMVLYWGVAFGFVSRRFETEADLVAARTAPPVEGGAAPYAAARRMAAALERVAWLNHVPVWAPSWRHFTIEKRMEILIRAELDPSIGARFERLCDGLRGVATALLAAGLLCGGILIGVQHGRAPESLAQLQAYDAVERGRQALVENRYAAAREQLLRGIDGGADTARARLWLAECERALGREDEARREEAIARKKKPPDPRDRLRLRQAPVR
jgi:Zn-dependent protease with chaperone function